MSQVPLYRHAGSSCTGLYRGTSLIKKSTPKDPTGGLCLQRYLAHKKTPTPLAPPRTLGIALRWGPRGVRFLGSEVPL